MKKFFTTILAFLMLTSVAFATDAKKETTATKAPVVQKQTTSAKKVVVKKAAKAKKEDPKVTTVAPK